MIWFFQAQGGITLGDREIGRWSQLQEDGYYRVQLNSEIGVGTPAELIAYLVKDDLSMFFGGVEILTGLRHDEQADELTIEHGSLGGLRVSSTFGPSQTKARSKPKPEPMPSALTNSSEDTGYFRLEAGQELNFQRPARSLLALEVRAHWPQAAGSAYLLQVSVNGSLLEGPLINKRPSFVYKDGRQFSYRNSEGNWKVFYSHDFEANNSSNCSYQVLTDPGEAYRYLWVLPESEEQLNVRVSHVGHHDGKQVEAHLEGWLYPPCSFDAFFPGNPLSSKAAAPQGPLSLPLEDLMKSRDSFLGDWWTYRTWFQTPHSPGQWQIQAGATPVQASYHANGRWDQMGAFRGTWELVSPDRIYYDRGTPKERYYQLSLDGDLYRTGPYKPNGSWHDTLLYKFCDTRKNLSAQQVTTPPPPPVQSHSIPQQKLAVPPLQVNPEPKSSPTKVAAEVEFSGIWSVKLTYKSFRFGEETWEAKQTGELLSSGFWTGSWRKLEDGLVEVEREGQTFVLEFVFDLQFGLKGFTARYAPYVDAKGQKRQHPLQGSEQWRKSPCEPGSDSEPLLGEWYAWDSGTLVKLRLAPGGGLWDSRQSEGTSLTWKAREQQNSFEISSKIGLHSICSLEGEKLKYEYLAEGSQQYELEFFRSYSSDIEIVGKWELKVYKPERLGFSDGLVSFPGTFHWDGRPNWSGKVHLGKVGQGKILSQDPLKGLFALEFESGDIVTVEVREAKMRIFSQDNPQVTLAEGVYHSHLPMNHPNQMSRHQIGTIYDQLAKADREERKKRVDFEDPIVGIWFDSPVTGRLAFDAYGQAFNCGSAGIWECTEPGLYKIIRHDLGGFSHYRATLSESGELRLDSDPSVYKRHQHLGMNHSPLDWSDQYDSFLWSVRGRKRKEHPYLK